MAIIQSINNTHPVFDGTCWFAPNAVIVGDVVFEKKCTVWFSAVVRGDVNSITIGENTNIQDNVTVHCTYETAKTMIGKNVSIGHNAVVHGCTIEDDVLIGMGAIIMDHAVIKKGAVIAAGAVVLSNTVVEENSLYAGIPAKKIKKTSHENKEMIKKVANNYIKYADWFRKS